MEEQQGAGQGEDELDSKSLKLQINFTENLRKNYVENMLRCDYDEGNPPQIRPSSMPFTLDYIRFGGVNEMY